jgi:hypothetical protein
VLGSSRLRHRLVLLGGAWFAAAAGYYGLALLADGISSGRIGSDDSVYVTLLSAFAYEIPAIAAAGLAVERAGRKATGIAAFMQGGWVGGWALHDPASQPASLACASLHGPAPLHTHCVDQVLTGEPPVACSHLQLGYAWWCLLWPAELPSGHWSWQRASVWQLHSPPCTCTPQVRWLWHAAV